MHREPAPGMSVHRQRRETDILKRRLLRSVLTFWNVATFKIRYSGLSNDRCPRGVYIPYARTLFVYARVRTYRRGLRVVSSNI